ncbi:MAG: redoxin domain-containing protein [Bdellovibrionales bacterium]|nr:redoxin domain-containing protein [Bdellovibrionales bacterium]
MHFVPIFIFLLVQSSIWSEPGIPPYPAPRPGEVYTSPAFSEYVPDALNVGEKAPLLELKKLKENSFFRLDKALGNKPIVLIFGSYTCPVFRGQIRELLAIGKTFSDRYDFYFVYLREAHPDSRLYLKENGSEFLKTILQTETVEEREDIALKTKETFQIEIPILIDDNLKMAHKSYAAWPVRFVIISSGGLIRFKGRMGPHGFWPDELRQALLN